jgi:thymidylate kinase
VFDAFQTQKLEWAILRDEDVVVPLGDVDILVSRGSLESAGAALRELGFVRLPTVGRGSHAFYIAFSEADGSWIKLDIVTELAFGPYFAFPTDMAEGCIARRTVSGQLPVLAADDAFWSLLLHCLLDKGTIAPKRASRLRALSQSARSDGPWRHLVDELCPPGWSSQRLIEASRNAGWRELEPLASAMRRNCVRSDPYRAAWRLASGRVGKLLEAPRAFLSRPSMSVALLGPDGVGKTTLAVGIRNSFPLPTYGAYMGLWQHPSTESRRPLPGLDLFGRLAGLWRRYLLAMYHRARRRLVIFDRYSYDALIPQPGHQTRRNRIYLWLLGHACPPPDLVFLLDAAGEIAHARKGEYPAEYLDRERSGFLSLQRHVPRIQVVDASRAQDAVRYDVTERIWQRYVGRWRYGADHRR